MGRKEDIEKLKRPLRVRLSHGIVVGRDASRVTLVLTVSWDESLLMGNTTY